MRILKKIAVITGLILSLVLFSGCWDSTETVDSGLKANINEFNYTFFAIGDNDSELKEVAKYSKLSVDTDYLLEIGFKVSANKANDGNKLINIALSFSDINVLDGRLEEVGSGSHTDFTFTTDQGTQGKKSFVYFKLPSEANAIKEIRIAVKLSPIIHGQSHVSMIFESSDAMLVGSDSDGFTKNVEIEQVKLNTPSLTFNNSSLMLIWNHVKNADYYKIIVDGEVLKNNGKEVIIDSAKYDVNSEIFVNITNYKLVGAHIVKVQAFSNSASYIVSECSNQVTIII